MKKSLGLLLFTVLAAAGLSATPGPKPLTPVRAPEPAALVLLGTGLAALLAGARKPKR